MAQNGSAAGRKCRKGPCGGKDRQDTGGGSLWSVAPARLGARAARSTRAQCLSTILVLLLHSTFCVGVQLRRHACQIEHGEKS
jgi:hypothetical protein